MSQKAGVINERAVEEHFRALGYDVLNLNKSCPDLLVLKDGQIQFFVEVKGGSHRVHKPQRDYHKMMIEDFGFKTKIIRIVDGRIAELAK